MKTWRSTRTATIVGRDVAERFGWKVGDKVPLRSNIFRKRDGGDTWDLDVVGIYSVENGDNTNMFLQYDYLNEARTYGHDEVGWIIMRIDDPNRAPAIESAIDTLFANSSTETRTTTESAFLQGFANQMGNIGRIVTIVAAAVFFTMLLVTANAMAQSVRERVRDIAVMRTLGFSNGSIVTLVLVEGLVITVLGGVVGLWLGDALAKSVGKQMQQFLPLMMTPPNSYVTGMILAVGLGVLSCAIPCLQVSRLEVVDQLRRA
jgi:putative ABC transport system permease protein